MSASRLFLITLVIFALLFAAAVGIGARQNDYQPEARSVSPPNWTSALSDWFSPKLSLSTLQIVQGTCLRAAQSEFVVGPGSSCTLQVPSSGQQYRRAKLHLAGGVSVTVAYNASANQDPNLSKQQLIWPGKDPQSLVALSGVGTLTISCGSGATCQLQAQ